ncbi:DNA polymerase I, thermostable [compost metagenome]
MIAAYQTGDPYLNFAIQAGAAPRGATKASHGAVREQFKACALGVQYSMGEHALAARIGRSPAHARELLALHRRVYPVFWNWIEGALEHASVYGQLDTVYGWRLHTTAETKVPALLNYPMQSNGAEMLRLACCLAVDRGIRICAPVHDALLIEAPVNEIETAVSVTQASMAEASRRVLGSLELTSDAKVIRFPGRYVDDRGQAMWDTVMGLLHEVEQEIGISC